MSEDNLFPDLAPNTDKIPDEETKKLVEEMEAEKGTEGSDTPAEEAKTEEEVVEEQLKEEEITEEAEEETEEEPKEVDRTPKQIPAWKAKVAEKQIKKEFEKELSELKSEIELLKNKPKETTGDDIDGKIARLAEEKGVDADLIKEIVSLNKAPDLSDITQEIEQFKKDKAMLEAEKQFDEEFAGIVTEVKKEYPDATDGDLTLIKSNLKKTAFTEAYAKTPLNVIYKGLDQFRGFKPTVKKKTAEVSRGGKNREVNLIDFEGMTEEQLKGLSREDSDKYFEWVDKNKDNR